MDSSISFPNLTLKRGGPGRPKITFDQSTKRMKRQKTLDLRKSRKCSRAKFNVDVFNLLLLSSDPLITSKRELPKKKMTTLPKEAIELLMAPSLQPTDENYSSTQDDDDDSDDYDYDDDRDDGSVDDGDDDSDFDSNKSDIEN